MPLVLPELLVCVLMSEWIWPESVTSPRKFQCIQEKDGYMKGCMFVTKNEFRCHFTDEWVFAHVSGLV